MQPKKKILVVDDDRLITADLKDKLEALGTYVVCATAHTGREAIGEAMHHKPDLVLMDVVLSGDMDGIEAASEISSKLSIPVIYISANSSEEFLSRAKVTEPFGYILKPIGIRELHINIEIALYRHKIEQERKRLITDLQEAFSRIKMLHGCLPICASCKKIRDDKGYWTRVEKYISDHSDVDFTHGLCPECEKRFVDGAPML